MPVSFIAGFLLGLIAVSLYVWIERSKPPIPPKIPTEWPLIARLLVSRNEKKVWAWLEKVMYDQHIMIKLPVTRFTIPARQAEAEHWYGLLNRMYCTFTICNTDGRVVGCVDVPGSLGLSMSNQTLKHGLLDQCGIPYWVVEPDNLPHVKQIRTAFLGELAAGCDARDRMDSQLRNVADHLHAAVSRQRVNKSTGSADGTGGRSPAHHEEPLSEGWEQNSFMTPLDSRAAGLRRE